MYLLYCATTVVPFHVSTNKEQLHLELPLCEYKGINSVSLWLAVCLGLVPCCLNPLPVRHLPVGRPENCGSALSIMLVLFTLINSIKTTPDYTLYSYGVFASIMLIADGSI